MHITVRVHTVIAFLAGVILTVAAAFVFHPWRAGAAPGDDDATLVPITACRLIDTRDAFRVGTGDVMLPGETRVLQAHGTNGECTIPADATGLVLNVTALDATLPTFLTFWPDGDRPNASNLNPVPGQSATPNAVATQLADDGSFRVFNLQGNVEVVVDVTAYFSDSSLTEISERLDALEAADEQLRRAVGYNYATTGMRSGSGSGIANSPAGVRVTMEVCAGFIDCIELASPVWTERGVARFDARNTPRWEEVVERLTNGTADEVKVRHAAVNSSGAAIDGEVAALFDEDWFTTDEASDHPALRDLSGATIGSIAIVATFLTFTSNPTASPSPFSYAIEYDVVVETPGAPALDTLTD